LLCVHGTWLDEDVRTRHKTDVRDTLLDDLYAAFLRSGISVGELRKRAGLRIDRSTLSRKLRGKAPLSIEEGAAIAGVLDGELRFVRRRRAA